MQARMRSHQIWHVVQTLLAICLFLLLPSLFLPSPFPFLLPFLHRPSDAERVVESRTRYRLPHAALVAHLHARMLYDSP